MADLSSVLERLDPDQRRLFLRRLSKQWETPTETRATSSKAAASSILRDRSLPNLLSFGQQRMWFLNQLDPSAATYNLATGVRLEGPLAVAALRAAWNESVSRHEILRTTFGYHEGNGREPVQKIAEHLELELPLIDLGSLPAECRLREVTQWAGRVSRAPYDLSRGPMFRPLLFRLADQSHAMTLGIHHIISDFWSAGILIMEVTALYHAFVESRPDPLPPLALQYADFAQWQRYFLKGEELERQLEFWRERLAGAPQVLSLPTDRPRPATQSYRGAKLPVAIDRSLVAPLREVGQRHQATLFMTLLAAFQMLLGRYSGQKDIVVGTPVAGRQRVELERLIGMFVNTLVLRTDLAGDPSFAALLVRVRDSTRSAYGHQDLPFEKLVEELQPERNLSHAPLFQTVFNLPGTLAKSFEGSGLKLESLDIHAQTAMFDLVLTVEDEAAGLQGMFEYAVDLFDRSTATRLLGHWQALLAGIVADPSQRLSRMAMLSAPQRSQLVAQWNDTRLDADEEPRIEQLFERRARDQGEASAVVFGRQHLSYAELDRRGDRLARLLQSLGVGPGVLVGVYLDRSAQMVTALLGILKAGGAYVPLETRNPQARLKWILEAMEISLLLVSESRLRITSRILPSLPLLRHVVCLDPLSEAAAELPAGRHLWDATRLAEEAPGRLARGGPDELAYVIFTSGSTGTPKGVMVRHRPVGNLIRWVNRTFAVGPADRILFTTSPGFDLSVYDVFGMLAAGGVIRVAAARELEEPGDLVRLLLREPITFWDSAPAALQQLVPFFPHGDERPPSSALRLVFLSGDWIPLSLPGDVAASFPAARMIALGGATEATIWSNFFPVNSIDPYWKSIPYGRPIDNARYYVLEESLEPCAIGIAGDLYIGGDCLSSGYAAEVVLTASKYLPDPFRPAPGAAMYRTGDRARFLAGGDIEFLGRLDHQVKVRGFRIELGEIEAALSDHPALQDPIVQLETDPFGTKRLTAWAVVASPGPPVDALRIFLEDRLPAYMVPSNFVFLDALPVTANGKLDRKALPAPEWVRDHQRVAPRNPTEEVLAAIWSDVLQVEDIGVDDDFFDLGGHSLLATRVTAQVRQSFGVELELRTFFERPTVARLAELVSTRRRAGSAQVSAPIEPVPRDRPLALSFAQERLWILEQVEPGNTAYHVQVVLRLRGRLQRRALERTLEEIARRHESLRTVFEVDEDGRPIQVIEPAGPRPLRVVDLSGFPADEREAEARRLALDQTARPFDFAHGPLSRESLLALEERHHWLLVTMHHIVSDYWSMGVLVRELKELYEAFAGQRPSSLTELAVQYADFAHWQRQRFTAEFLDQELEFWRRRLAFSPEGQGLPVLELPTDRPRPTVQTFEGTTRLFSLDEEISASLRHLSRARSTTPFMTLLAAFYVLLRRQSGQSDFVVGSPIAGRGQLSTEAMIGFFTNTLVLRAEIGGDPSFSTLLDQVRETTLEAHAHQELPFEKLVAEIQPERDLGHTPLFQVMFVFQNRTGEVLELPDLVLEPVDVEATTAKFDLTLFLAEGEQQLAGAWEYNRTLFDAATIQRLSRQWASLLRHVVTHPERRLARLIVPERVERQQMILEWNDTRRVARLDQRGGELCVHELFAERLESQADRCAVTFAGHTWSYAELDQRSDRLARTLRRAGVGPEVRVGISMPRCLEMILAVLSTFKAGGVCLPLDPAYPARRLEFMLEDARAAVLLTREGDCDPLPDCPVPILRVPLDPAPELSTPAAAVAARPENLAYLIYTSGSTGAPKAVAMVHRALANLIEWHLAQTDQAGGPRTLQLTALSFDVSFQEIFSTLCSGATLVLVAEEARRDPALLARILDTDAVERMFLPPLLLDQWAEATDAWPARLKEVVVAGEQLQVQDRVTELFEASGHASLHNHYGPSESHVVTSFVLAGSARKWPRIPPIGRPVANSGVYLLDPQLRPLPLGAVGELYLGGDCLARGYLDRPALTAQRFVPDPLPGPVGRRLYRTGDLARPSPEGNLFFLGRIDHQIKVRGFRIELGEIESVLKQHGDVLEAAVRVHRFGAADSRLVAYVVEAREVHGELRDFLSKSLPEHMVPGHVMALEAMPLTPTGKIDRLALPAPERGVASAVEYVAPRSAAEMLVAGVYSEILEVETVGSHDSFFDLGGHSLSAIRVTSTMRQALDVEIPVRTIFEGPRVEELARFLENTLTAVDLDRLEELFGGVEELSDEELLAVEAAEEN